MSEKIIENMISMCLEDKRILRAVKIITQSRNLPGEIATSAYFVALETLKNIIIEQNSDKLSLFKDKGDAKQIINQFKKIINALPDEKVNKNAIFNKINEIDKIGNNESFFKIFELKNLVIDDKDKECLRMRNRFLHGNVPFDEETEQTTVRELHRIELKAHFLVCCLILKMAGYSGYVKNTLKFLDAKRFDNSIDEPFFREI